jgi:hypothetical protein
MDKEQDVKTIQLKKHKFKKESEAFQFEIEQEGLTENKTRGFGFFK